MYSPRRTYGGNTEKRSRAGKPTKKTRRNGLRGPNSLARSNPFQDPQGPGPAWHFSRQLALENQGREISRCAQRARAETDFHERARSTEVDALSSWFSERAHLYDPHHINAATSATWSR